MKDKLYILWTNADPITSELMVCMYAQNAILKHWWNEITVIIWGATVEYVSNNKSIQDRLLQMKNDGVTISVCKSCSEKLGVVSKIEALGFELKYWGEPLTKILKENHKLITI